MSLLGSGKDEARDVLAALGWRRWRSTDAKPVWRRVKEKLAARAKKPRRSRRPIRIRLSRPGGVAYAMSGEPMTPTRMDKWLFHARFYRTRPLAQAAARPGRVRLNGVRVEKPGHALKPGDILTLGRGGEVMAVRVLALAERRGPAAEAQQLYEIVAD